MSAQLFPSIKKNTQVLVALNQGEDKSAISPDSLFQVIFQFDLEFVLKCNLTFKAIWKVVPRFRGYQQQVKTNFLPMFNNIEIFTNLCRTLTSFSGTCWTASTLNSCNFSLVPNHIIPGWMNSDPPGQFLTVRYRVLDFKFLRMVCTCSAQCLICFIYQA